MPLPGSRLIHRQFEAWGRRVADGQHSARCRITDSSNQLVYDGPCRIQQGGQATLTPVAGDQRITAADYAVVVPAGALRLAAGHLVDVVECDGDPELVGGQLIVQGVTRGSIRFQQTLACDLHDQPAL